MYSGDQAQGEARADLQAGHGRFLCRWRGVIEGWGGMEVLRFWFCICSRRMGWHGGIADLFLLVQQQYAEEGAFADVHAGQGARRLGILLVVGI